MVDKPMEEPTKRIVNKKLTQRGFNAAFWKLLAGHGGGMTIAGSELVNLPVNAVLNCEYDANTDMFTITAKVRQSNKIITLNSGIITG
jgi:hypothetical protein